MDLDTALDLVRHHYNHAHEIHPETKDLDSWTRLLRARFNDLSLAVRSEHLPDHKLIAGKRALQIAAMALRVIEDLDLGLPPPDYAATPLYHTDP